MLAAPTTRDRAIIDYVYRVAKIRVRDRIAPFFWVTKPRIVELLLATAVPTLFLASDGLPTVIATIAVVIGGSAAAASANTYNSVYDRDIDAVMHRTGGRPMASGAISVRAGLIQATVLGVISVLTLGLLTNWLTAFLGFLAIVLYALGYTVLLKRSTPQNIVWGGAAGCMPVLIAWAAVTGTLSWTPAILFLIVFFWTPAHYWPLAIKYRDDYAAAGVPMLPVVAPARVVTRNVVVYSIAMAIFSIALIPVAPMGWVYTIGSVGLGVWFVVISLGLMKLSHRENADYQELQNPAMRVFHGSITYLALLFLLIGITPFLP